eukprot:CAMPEP_0202018890 /NCGR_PEP_ID=MMETSP0905-20130828/40576_1 /ASSEMBLY_ACC=CAM_ASM_000554 /TAXON_ID=420261 /ORGANISM="Thalassiosira antarctica, Strain CCMP982" /LENGTH=443 /DNA_ID=CAMNT_0048579981 /DNA_START=27 /DNA_END=1355 /DNA_ORIENTATION=+
MRTTAPDPPEFPLAVEETIPSLRRLSTTCSQDPPETSTTTGQQQKQKGLDPTEYQIKNSSSNNLKKSITSRKSKTSISSNDTKTAQRHGGGGGHGAMVLYEPPPPTDSTNQDTEVKPGALVTLEPREIKLSHARTTPTEIIASEDIRKGFDHCFVTVPCKERLSVLFATLRRSSERKVIVICSTWESAAFHAVLFRQLEMLHVYEMHENMKDGDVAFAYDEFLYLYPGILFSSEIAMREFDIPPNVDYLIQYEPPMNPTEYIYRMSNAKIYRTSCHKALLFLTPDEMIFLEYFDGIENKELEARKVSEFQERVEKLVTKHSELNDFAWKAFRAFLLAYESHSHSNVYDPSKIDEGGIRRAFGQPQISGYSSKYFVYNNGGETGEKNGSKGEKNGATVEKREDKDSHQWREKETPKAHQWRDNKETTWRKGGGKAWATREDKTW